MFKDKLIGRVTKVTDGDTFEISVNQVIRGSGRFFQYSSNEIIRIAGLNAPELNTLMGSIAKDNLNKKLNGKSVAVTIEARDVFGRIVGTVEIRNSSIFSTTL